MAIFAAIVVTAVVVGLVASAITRNAVRASIVSAIDGRQGAGPVHEHRRILEAAKSEAASAVAHSALLQQALDALSSGVIVADSGGKVLVRNRLATEISAKSHEQTLIDVASTELLAAAAIGEQVERQVDIFGPPPRSLFIHAVPIWSDDEIAGALAVIDDVTDLQRIDKTRRDFVANLSHELRTPVGAASLLGEMLVDEADPAVRQQLTDRLLIETDRMTATIDDLLELSRIESNVQGYDETIDVRSVIDEALARTRVAAETKGVQVGALSPTGPITVIGNRDQLLTALVNLVENAIKYSTTGDSVSVRSRVEDDTVLLVVQDTGRGIPARDLTRIFERFYRVDRSRDQATGGTGIGLSIVRHVALNHGGTVDVKSFEGEGSTFTLTLPQAGSPARQEQPTHEVN